MHCERLCLFAAYKFFVLYARHLETKSRQCVAQNLKMAKTSAQSSLNINSFLINGSFHVLVISNIQDVSKILGHSSGVISPYKKKKKDLHKQMSANTEFSRYPPPQVRSDSAASIVMCGKT